MRQAIEDAAFTLHFQPILSTQSLRPMAVEALVRANAKGVGQFPGSFIPLAESSGLILPLGNLILRLAVAQLAAWRQEGGLQVPLSVNISAHQLADPQLPRRILDLLTDYKVPLALLKLELTETALFDAGELTRMSLFTLHNAGVRLWLDDFGTGYSSLTALRNFPFEGLKIDRSFIQAMIHDPDTATIVSNIIALGHALNLLVVAEGVETREQLTYLKAYRCPALQGYLFAKPMPADEVKGLLG